MATGKGGSDGTETIYGVTEVSVGFAEAAAPLLSHHGLLLRAACAHATQGPSQSSVPCVEFGERLLRVLYR